MFTVLCRILTENPLEAKRGSVGIVTNEGGTGDVDTGVDPAFPAPEDWELLLRFRDRDDMDAFEELIDRHQTPLLRAAEAVLGEPHGAQEVVQDAFLTLGRRAGRLVRSRDGGLRAWLGTVVRNACLDRLRRRRRDRTRALVADAVAAGDRGDELEAADSGRVLWRAVDALPPLERAVVVLRYRERRTYAAIAEELGKSATHVGVLLHTAITRLRGDPRLRKEVGA